ncbi:MAG: ATP synthase F1 subunit epsilon [Raineya sp.]|nr:ATP synthase F1 subunit epsilon [Raineya sp.]MDW8297611.1 ATP synthase F1 subunit epsilon [Raineya sp.]
MYLEIITPDKKLFAGEVTAVTLPGKKGSFQVLKDHAPLISTLESGKIRYKTPQGEQSLEVLGGVAEVLKNKVLVLVEGLKK